MKKDLEKTTMKSEYKQSKSKKVISKTRKVKGKKFSLKKGTKGIKNAKKDVIKFENESSKSEYKSKGINNSIILANSTDSNIPKNPIEGTF